MPVMKNTRVSQAQLQQMVKMAAGKSASAPLPRPPASIVPGLTPAKVAAGVAMQKVLSTRGGAPIAIPQEVRASPPNPSAARSAEKILRPAKISASRIKAPIKVTGASFQKFPIAAIFQGGGFSGAPIQVSNMNGAPIAVAPVGSSYIHGLGANADTSVAAQVRAKKQLRDMGVQVSGDYTDAIRQAAGFAFGPKRMPKQGYMAASYSYPAQQMVVGATLSGQPIVAAPAVPPAPARVAPRLVKRDGIRGQISSSPSEERRKLLSTLQGLGALGGLGAIEWNAIDQTKISSGVFGMGADTESGITCKDEMSCKQVKVERVKIALRNAGKDANNDNAVNFYGATKYNAIDTLTGLINATWDGWFLQGRKLDDVHYAGSFDKFVSWIGTSGIGDKAAKAAADAAQQRAAAGRTLPPPPGGAGGYGSGAYAQTAYAQTAYGRKPGMGTGMMIGLGVAAVALVGGVAYFTMKK